MKIPHGALGKVLSSFKDSIIFSVSSVVNFVVPIVLDVPTIPNISRIVDIVGKIKFSPPLPYLILKFILTRPNNFSRQLDFHIYTLRPRMKMVIL